VAPPICRRTPCRLTLLSALFGISTMRRFAVHLLWVALIWSAEIPQLLALYIPRLTKPNRSRLYLVTQDRGCGDGRHFSREEIVSAIRSTLLLSVCGPLIHQPSPACSAPSSDASISPCSRPTNGGGANCVSTASVKQVDLFISPWTWAEGISAEEVIGRLKGAIATDGTLSLVGQNYVDGRYICRVRAARNFCTDEIEFVVNPADRVVIFRSQQVDGPDTVSDFGANRKRLDELRRRIGVVDVMGAEFASADSGPREGTVGQLRAFWGLQSGGGYESVLLDDIDE
jgi:uncharacterized protein (DUF1499 family)